MEFLRSVKNELSLVEAEIVAAIPKKPKEVYGMLPSFIKKGGKRIRPALVLLCCAAVGGNKRDAIKYAALVEMFHNFTLIHDDIADSSLIRRGSPTLHVQYGIPIALNSGDALYTLLWSELSSLRIDDSMRAEIMRCCTTSFKRVVEGQGIELNWYRENRFDISEREYFEMVKRKTAALMGLSCELGALAGKADKRVRHALYSFGEKIGTAFQVHDDILNIIGEFKHYKKEIGDDITEGKRTLMVINTMAYATEKEKALLKRILSAKSKKRNDIAHVISLFKKYGSIEHAAKKAMLLAQQAKDYLAVLPDREEKHALLKLADFVVSRKG